MLSSFRSRLSSPPALSHLISRSDARPLRRSSDVCIGQPGCALLKARGLLGGLTRAYRLTFPVNKVDSLSLVLRSRPRTISPMSTTKGRVIEPVPGDLKLSIPKMKTIPEICPMSKSRPLDVPSGAG